MQGRPEEHTRFVHVLGGVRDPGEPAPYETFKREVYLLSDAKTQENETWKLSQRTYALHTNVLGISPLCLLWFCGAEVNHCVHPQTNENNHNSICCHPGKAMTLLQTFFHLKYPTA